MSKERDLELSVVDAPGKLGGSAQSADSRDFPVSDDEMLARLGKRPLLNRSFGFMSMLGFSCTALISWEGMLSTSVPALANGGPAGVIWGFLMSWVGSMAVYCVLGELASIAPTSAGQYHWAAMMAPPRSSTFLAYLTAWFTVTSWLASSVATAYMVATQLQGIAVLSQPSYAPEPYQTVLAMWAFLVLSVLINSTTSGLLARFEGLFLLLHLAGFFGILIPLIYFAPHNDASFVFTQFSNVGGWASQGLAFMVGFPTLAGPLVGADCAVHMSEEIRDAATVVPRAIVWSVAINGALAFAMGIAMLFCITDLDSAIAASNTVFYPYIEVFRAGVGSTAGAVAMASIVVLISFGSSVSIAATASRMIWSFARDRGLPLDRHLVKLTKRTSLPVIAVLATLSITMLLSLIVLGSSIALADLISMAIAALYSSYLIVCLLLLWRRCSGAIQPYAPGVHLGVGQLAWGPWKLPEPLGVANNILACLWCVLLLFWSFWPQATPTSPQAMNWSVLVVGCVTVFSVIWYVLRARKYFKGPIKEI
ncbi:amino acid transporter [Thozetella sp. PMI_491]|nr:amino acid transporter [Thozetella sp. PMI_491]